MNGRTPFVDRTYEKDEFVQKWLIGLSPRTKENYLKEFKKWLDFIQMTPTQQIKKRIKDTVSQDLTERTFFEVKFGNFMKSGVDVESDSERWQRSNA